MLKIIHPDSSISWINPRLVTHIWVEHDETGVRTHVNLMDIDEVIVSGNRGRTIAMSCADMTNTEYYELDCSDPATE